MYGAKNKNAMPTNQNNAEEAEIINQYFWHLSDWMPSDIEFGIAVRQKHNSELWTQYDGGYRLDGKVNRIVYVIFPLIREEIIPCAAYQMETKNVCILYTALYTVYHMNGLGHDSIWTNRRYALSSINWGDSQRISSIFDLSLVFEDEMNEWYCRNDCHLIRLTFNGF